MAADGVVIAMGLCSGASTVASAFIAWRAFGHTTRRDDAAEAREDARTDATTTAIVTELRSALERAFSGIRENAERFRVHDNECAKDKAKMAADLRYVAETVQNVTGRLETLNRQMIYLARDNADDDTARKLGKA